VLFKLVWSVRRFLHSCYVCLSLICIHKFFTTLPEILFVVVITKIILVHYSSVLIERNFSFSYELDIYMLQVLFCGVNEIITVSIICFSQRI